ncbi:FecR family protein [Chitinophaga vietnamensis]|uniref:FecR family protein n=1 Tax=Chitinophaga vietnamensis TaxID=2593957 RepID=UPI00117795BE|nr:FecR domain-containing protein [Chitinophaga vietnamensis]
MTTRNHITVLLEKYAAGTISAEEQEQLSAAISAADDALYTQLLHDYEQVVMSHTTTLPPDARLFAQLKSRITAMDQELAAPRVIRWKQYAAAAAVALLAVWGAQHFFFRHNAIAPTAQQLPVPGGNKAILTLDNGATVALDSGNKVIQQGTASIYQKNGQIQYSKTTGAVAYNTLSTPRGGQFQVVLPDGSHVWLNAASSIRYPTAFTGHERKVELSGEGYFDISPDAQRPFVVSCGGTAIQVLGTEFNVMAYSNEPAQQACLVSGSIQVIHASGKTLLQPGRMAFISANDVTVKTADIEQVTAWKNGQLSLNTTDLKSLMRQVERWYDVEVRYEGTIPDRQFGGLVSRNTQLSTLIQFLQESGIHIKEDGRIITVMP